ncbi:ATP-binding protein [Camelimonas abortus]|uniref:histidine kinase n=1 Tax=Camelimonas abortus TaxID=1017184 RepID=A0ABV7LG67_9HYPH
MRSVSAALARVLPPEALPVGRRWGDMGDHIDAAAALDAHVMSARAWSGLVAVWRLGDSGVSAPVEFGAAPVRDAQGRPDGQRGYGLIRLDEAAEPAARTPTARTARAGETPDNAGDVPRQATSRGAAPAPPEAPAPLQAGASAHDHARRAPAHEPGAVSPPAAGETVASPAAADDVPAGRPLPPPDAARGPATAPRRPPRLSAGDRQTLRDIARALGAKVEPEPGGDPQTAGEGPPPARHATARTGRSRAHAPRPSAHVAAHAATHARSLRDLAAEIAAEAHGPRHDGQGAPHPDAGHPDAARSDAALPDGPEGERAPGAARPAPSAPGRAGEAQAARAIPAPAAAAPVVNQGASAAPAPAPDLAAVRAGAAVAAVRQMMQSAPVAMLVSRGDAVLHANQDFVALSRYSGFAELARAGVSGLFPEAVPARGFHGRAALLGARGVRTPVILVCLSAPWDGGEALLTFATRDPSAEAEARARHLESEAASLSAREAELRAILDTATDGVLLLDAQGRILSVNRSAEALFGYEQNELVGEPVTRLLDGASHQTAMDYLALMRAGGPASLLNDGREIVGRVRQGGECHLFMTLGRTPSASGERFCAVLRDVTAWKKTEHDLIESRERAEAANAQKSDFLARMSHEVRTPLGAMIGFAELMLEERLGPIANPRYREYIRDIHESGQYVISLVNDLLDLARIEAGRMELNFASIDLNAVLSSCVALMQPQAAKARVVLRSSLDPALPPVVADERSMRQIALNIIGNALKFTDAGGQVIVSSLRNEAAEVVIRVRDTGIGMTEEEAQEALKPFRRLAPGRKAPGTGLGLPLTAALTEANRGRLRIASKPGEGTLVEVTLPAARVLAG